MINFFSEEKDGWSQEATACFEQLSQGKVLEASVTGHANDNIPLVELFLPAPDGKVSQFLMYYFDFTFEI